MATWQEFRAIHNSVVLTGPGQSEFKSNKVVQLILSEFGSHFNGKMQVLPLSDDMPPEIPRVQLSSEDGKWEMSAGPARIEVEWKNAAREESDLVEIVRQLGEITRHYATSTGTRFGRIALVVRRLAVVPNPAETLIDRFCNTESRRGPLNRSQSFELHNYKTYPMPFRGGQLVLNSWVRCTSVKASDNAPAILVLQDLNSLGEPAELELRRFDADGIVEFLTMAVPESSEIIQKYFPG